MPLYSCNNSPLISFQPSVLYRTIAAALLVSAAFNFSQAHAQDAVPKEDPASNRSEEEIDTLLVTGIAFSQRSALDRKKEAGTMSDSLVAEDIGAFPDKNIAEALQRIPGIQLNRDDGEGSTVSIRGVDPDLLRVEMNNVGAMGMAGSRAVDFRDMASELVKSLDVIKGSEARLTEGGIGGTIQINTRKPNEFKRNFFSVSGEAQYNDLIGDVMPKFNITGVYKPSEKLGFLMNLTGSDKTTVIHALRNTEWNRLTDFDKSPEKTVVNPLYESVANYGDCTQYSGTARTDCQKQWFDFNPHLPRYGIWERSEQRISANTMIEYQFTDHLSGHLGVTYNEREKTAYDLNLQFEANSVARIDLNSAATDHRKNVVSFTTSGAAISNRALNFSWDQSSTMVETGFDFKTDNVELKGIIATSKARQDIDSRESQVMADAVAGIVINLNEKGLPDIDVSNAYYRDLTDPNNTSDKFDINDLANYNNRVRFKHAPSHDDTQEDMGKIDFTFRPESGLFRSFRAGIQLTSQSFVNSNREFNIIRDQGATYDIPGTGRIVWTREDHQAVVGNLVTRSPEFFKGHSLPVNTMNGWTALDSHAVANALREYVADYQTPNDIDPKIGDFDVTVETQAAYLQADFFTEIRGMPLYGNFGVRAVNTETDANGDVNIRVYVDQLDADGNIRTNPTTGAYLGGIQDLNHPDSFKGRRTVSSDYSDVLPSLNVTLGIIPQQLELYVGIAKVMARPRVTDINVNATCNIYTNITAQINNDPNTCTAGNPYLDPYRATQQDIALTWYPDKNSIVSAVYFTKDISSWIINRDTNYNVDFFNDGRVWDVNQKLNGKGVDIKGVEVQASTIFSWLPGVWSGFGGSVNYTYMEAENVGLFNELTGEELPFPSQSRDSYNITLFYEADNWSTRAAYNFRSDYLSNPSDRSGNPAFTEDAGYLDLKFNYNIAKNLRLHVDARNLTGETKSTNAGPGRMSSYDWSGREYSIGLSYKM